MNRLRDTDSDELLFRRGVEVLRKIPPTSPAPDVKQRVWNSLNRARARARERRGLGIPMLKLAMVAIVALAAGTAGAVIARRWIAPKVEMVDGGGSPSRASLPPGKTRPVPAVVPAPAAPVIDAADDSRSRKSPGRSTPRKLAGPPPGAASVARERTEVLDALIALRREHDPVRAGTLLARYLSAHPRGALREEALVLAIEAADARGDRAGGVQLAQAYQDEFPAGRFLPFARSHTH